MGETSERVQGLRVRVAGGVARVGTSPAGIPVTTADPARLRYWAGLLTGAAVELETGHALPAADQPTLFETEGAA